MVVKEDQERMRTLISDTITLLCRNGLAYKSEFNINALIGITLDKHDVFLVDIRETVRNQDASDNDEVASEDETRTSGQQKHRKRNKRRKNCQESGSEEESFDNSPVETPEKKANLVKEETQDDDDIVFIKDEPCTDNHMQFNLTDVETVSQQQQQELNSSLSQVPVNQLTHNLNTSWNDITQQSEANDDASRLSGMPDVSFGAGQDPSQELSAVAASAAARGDFTCPRCGRRLQSSASLKLHYSTQHLRLFKLRCQLCGKGYPRQDKLTAHLIGQHRFASPFVCALCGKAFTRNDYLQKHLQTDHADQRPPDQADQQADPLADQAREDT